MLQHVQRVSGHVCQTCRFFAVPGGRSYISKKRYRRYGFAGLREQSRRPNPVSHFTPHHFSARLLTKLYKSQLPVVEKALETAGLMLGTDKSRGYCLEMICADFLAGANLSETQT
jgi:hypothetical protein